MDELDLVWPHQYIYICVCVCVCVSVSVEGPRTEVPYLKIDLLAQAKKHNQTLRITLT